MNRWADSVYAPPPAASPWRVEQVYAGLQVRLYSFGRRALAAGLKAAGVKAGDSVLLPSFICRDLLSSLAANGAKAVYYGVKADLSPSSPPEAWPKAAAVIAVDFFGFPQNLAPFEAYAERTGATLIEDNAHGLFSHDPDGRPLGARAPFGILSLRKSLALTNGAALLAEPGRELPGQERFAELPRGAAKATARKVASKVGAKAMLAGLTAFRAARGAARGAADSGAAGETELPSPAIPCHELQDPITVGGVVEETTRRRALHAELEKIMTPAGFPPLLGPLPPLCVPYGYAYRAEGAAIERAERLLRGMGLRSLPWPDLPGSVAPSAPPEYRNVRLAHFLW